MKTSISVKDKKNMAEMKQQVQIMMASPAAMEELIQYFETHGRLLDRQELVDAVAAAQEPRDTNPFVSCIRFNGVPILPPVMTNSRREEVRQDRHSAVFKENRLKARQRKHLMEVANKIVESTEPRKPSSETRPGRATSARLPLERPSVLRPVVSSAWGSVAASGISAASAQSMESVTATGMSSMANTFATAEQGQDDFGLQTLDSVCSDFMSLEETLPTNFNGVPLTSVRQQKISHDLLRLSKILKVQDFNSTAGSDASEFPPSESAAAGDSGVGEVKKKVTSALDNVSASFFHESQDTVVEVAPENNTSGFVDNSIEGSPVENREQNLSGGGGSTNTSGMSSANTTGTTDSHRSNRSSPRSLKNNTVHFASFITEYIDTSASLSSENITVVKKKLPGDQQAAASKQHGSKADSSASTTASLRGEEKTVQENGLLSNVSLAEPDSPVTPTPNPDPSSLPFQQYAKVDPSSSDKENDAKQANKMLSAGMNLSSSSSAPQRNSSKSGGRGLVLQTGGSTSVTDSQGSSRSDATVTTSESSNSTLIEDVATAINRDSTTSLPLNIVEGQEEEGAGVGKDPEKNAGSAGAAAAPVARKPKKLPPEPPQGTYQHHSRQVKVTSDRNPAGGDAVVRPHKGHVRRGSYTLAEPSVALVRAQSCPPVGAGGVGLTDEDDEDHTKPLNIPPAPQPTVPSESEAMGKAEHINKYLSHLSQVQLHSSEDVTASQLSVDLQSLSRSQASMSSMGGGEEVEEFEILQRNLMEAQRKELEELFIQQRREQMLLQGEIEVHQKRMKEQQDFLTSNAPENIKVQSQSHGGELSPDSSMAEESNNRFNFPGPKQTQINLHQQQGASSPLLLNTSTSSTSPKVRRLVLRSPVKFHPGRRNFGRVIVPPEAYESEMRVKFEKLTAAAKGFLTRCLLHSDKVQELVKTIKDTREFAFSFQSETPIRKGNLSNQDRTLLERIVAQLQAALLDIHEIFFDTPVNEQMAFIEQTRMNNREKRIKSSTDESVRSSAPRISMATLKAQERRRRAQEAESIVFGTSSARPRTAPPSTNSPRAKSSVDLSGPLKRHFQQLLIKATKPVAMQAAHLAHQHMAASPIRLDNSSRAEKNRPQTAPEKSASARPKKPVSAATAASSGHVMENVQPKFNIRVKQPPHQQQAQSSSGSKQSSKLSKASSKSWR